MRICFRALVCAALLCGPSFADPDRVVLTINKRAYGYMFVTRVTSHEADTGMSWSAENEHPPLSPRKARAIAEEFLSQSAAKDKKWRLHSIVLERYGGGEKWYYIIRFDADRGKHGGMPNPKIDIAVLMDGKVVTSILGKIPEDSSEPLNSLDLE